MAGWYEVILWRAVYLDTNPYQRIKKGGGALADPSPVRG